MTENIVNRNVQNSDKPTPVSDTKVKTAKEMIELFKYYIHLHNEGSLSSKGKGPYERLNDKISLIQNAETNYYRLMTFPNQKKFTDKRSEAAACSNAAGDFEDQLYLDFPKCKTQVCTISEADINEDSEKIEAFLKFADVNEKLASKVCKGLGTFEEFKSFMQSLIPPSNAPKISISAPRDARSQATKTRGK